MLMPKTVAIAEPASHQKWTKMGTAIAPGIMPDNVKYSGFFVSWTPRIQPFPAISTKVTGIASAAMRSHKAVPAAVVGSPVKARANTPPKIHMITASSPPCKAPPSLSPTAP